MTSPTPRQVATWQDAELNARDWMRAWGFTDARLTNPGADEGIDIISRHAIAQVKFEAHDVGRQYLQQLVGARGRRTDVRLIFFTGASYSAPAVEYANHMGIALFQYRLDGQMRAVNPAATGIATATPVSAVTASGKRTFPPVRKAGLGLLIVSAVLLVAGLPEGAGLFFLMGIIALLVSFAADR